MKELETAISNAASEAVRSGAFADLIKKQVADTIQHIIKDSLSAYSSFGKQIREEIQSSLAIKTEDLGLAKYNRMVLAIVKAKLDEQIEIRGRAEIAKYMERLLGTDAPKEMKLSKLIDQFKRWAVKQFDAKEKCTVILCTQTYGSRWLYLDSRPNAPQYQCGFSMMISSDGRVTISKLAGQDPKSVFMGSMSAFAESLFCIQASGTKLIIDEENPDLYFSEKNGEEEDGAD